MHRREISEDRRSIKILFFLSLLCSFRSFFLFFFLSFLRFFANSSRHFDVCLIAEMNELQVRFVVKKKPSGPLCGARSCKEKKNQKKANPQNKKNSPLNPPSTSDSHKMTPHAPATKIDFLHNLFTWGNFFFFFFFEISPEKEKKKKKRKRKRFSDFNFPKKEMVKPSPRR